MISERHERSNDWPQQEHCDGSCECGATAYSASGPRADVDAPFCFDCPSGAQPGCQLVCMVQEHHDAKQHDGDEFDSPLQLPLSFVLAAIDGCMSAMDQVFSLSTIMAFTAALDGWIATGIVLRNDPERLAAWSDAEVLARLEILGGLSGRSIEVADRAAVLVRLASAPDAGRAILGSSEDYRSMLLDLIAALARDVMGERSPARQHVFAARSEPVIAGASDSALLAAMQLHLIELGWHAERGKRSAAGSGAANAGERVAEILTELRGPAEADGLGPVTRALWAKLGATTCMGCVARSVAALEGTEAGTESTHARD